MTNTGYGVTWRGAARLLAIAALALGAAHAADTHDELYEENFGSAFHLAIMPARLAVERRARAEAATLDLEAQPYLAWDRYLWPQATQWFARGLGAVHTESLDEAREAETRMVELRDRASDAGERGFATFIEIDRLVLAGAIAQADGDADAAVALLEEAATLEGTVEKHPVTPGALLPPYEALGDLLPDRGAAAVPVMHHRTTIRNVGRSPRVRT